MKDMKNDRVRVLQMTPPEVNNGVYKYVFGYLPYLSREAYEVGFLTRGFEELAKTQEYKEYQFNIHPFVSTQRDDPSGLAQTVRKVLSQYDIVHLHTSSWRGFMIEEIAMDIGMKKVIVHSHSSGIDVAESQNRKMQIEEHIRYRNLFDEKYATDFCACSYKAAEWLFGEKIDAKKIKIMCNAIDIGKYAYDDSKRQKIRLELGIENKYVIGNVGRYSYQKNQEFLITLFSKAVRRNASLHLLCMGQGDELVTLKKLVDRLNINNNVTLLSWTEDVGAYMSAMDLFCLPSRFEGLAISMIEAQASGLKCIVSENVTSEANVCGNNIYLPLVEEIWIDEILMNSYMNIERPDNSEIIKNAGYDIKEAAHKLLELYKI